MIFLHRLFITFREILIIRKIKFIDLHTQQTHIRDKIDLAINKVLDHGQYILGPEVSQLENELAAFTKARHVLSCANGTDALKLLLIAWEVGPGDAVFVPSFSYVATAEAAAQLGATPFFVDVGDTGFHIGSESLKQAITDAKNAGLRPAVLIPVDLFGQPSDIDKLDSVAREAGIKILIDGAQSFGAVFHGHHVGTMGDATTTSFYPAKPFGCYGDGGAIFTQDDELAARVRSLRWHGLDDSKAGKYNHKYIGLNSRLDTIQAAILLEKLKIFPDELKQRGQIAAQYNNELENTLAKPLMDKGVTSSWAQYTLTVKNRTAIMQKLEQAGIPCCIYYKKIISQQVAYRHYPSVATGLPNSNALTETVLSLPIHPYMTTEEVSYVIEVFNAR